MKMELSLLHQMFDHLPEAVLVLQDSNPIFRNTTAQALLPSDELPPPVLLEYLSAHPGEILVTHKDTFYLITLSEYGPYHLLILRPQRQPEWPNVSSFLPARLRGHLSNLAITTEQLADLLSEEESFSEYHTLLSIQTQAIYRILRLAKQMELSVNDWEKEYPLCTVDLVSLCTSISSELASRKGALGPQFSFHSELPLLLTLGNKTLLEQLVLGLLSNAIKAAGSQGTVEFSLLQKHGRAILTVWNDGPDIPEDRLLQLFMPQHGAGLPRPQDSGGLDLWLAHRIALFHGGVIMAGNRPKGGSEFVLSLPTTLPKTMNFKSADQIPPDDGFSPVLIGLADALPPKAFDPLEP